MRQGNKVSMIIHNGDHAQFEIDNANVPKEDRPK